jgi:hypothetical protein
VEGVVFAVGENLKGLKGLNRISGKSLREGNTRKLSRNLVQKVQKVQTVGEEPINSVCVEKRLRGPEECND